jgi:hypothetical protein
MKTYKIEKWSAELEKQIAKTGSSEGVPYQVAYWGELVTVTRRCAHEMFRMGMITGAKNCRFGDADKRVFDDRRKQRVESGSSIDINVKPSGKPGTWIIYSKAMAYEAPSTNPARDMMLLTNEWWEMLDHGDGSFEHQCAGDWRLQN